MEAMTMSQFRTGMAAAFNRVDAGQRVVLRRRDRLYALMSIDADNECATGGEATKVEILHSISQGLDELRQAQAGILTPTPAKEFLKELQDD